VDRHERIEDDVAVLRKALESFGRNLWCCLPGLIEKVDFQKMTCVVQPAIQAILFDEKGGRKPVNLPLFEDVPIWYPQGGFGVLTFPIKKGDECLVVFADRCIDAWWQSGGIQGQIEFRQHDLSDGFALVGVRSQPRVLNPSPDPENVQLRSEDGKTHVSMKPDGTVAMINEKGTLKLRPSGQFVFDSDFEGESIIRAKKIHYYIDDTESDPWNAVGHEGF
jgi:hypothetical protein